MTEFPDLESFIRRLLRATRGGKVVWSRAPSFHDGYQASTDGGAIRVREYSVAETAPDATVVEVLDSEGNVTASKETDPERPGAWLDWENDLKELFAAAKFTGSGAAKILETLTERWDLPPDPADDDIPF